MMESPYRAHVAPPTRRPDLGRAYGSALNDWYTCKREVTAKAAPLAARAAKEGRSFSLDELVGARPKVTSDASQDEIADATAVLASHVRRMREALAAEARASDEAPHPATTIGEKRAPAVFDRAPPPELREMGRFSLRRAYEIDTAASPEVIRTTLRELVDNGALAARAPLVFAPAHASRAFTPFAFVSITPHSRGSRVFIEMRPHNAALAAAYVWMAVLSLVFLGTFMSCATGRPSLPGIVVLLATFFGWRGFLVEARKLDAIFFATLPPPAP